MPYKAFEDPGVAAVFAAYPDPTKEKLLFLRQLIFDVAAEIERVGVLEETLKWGQPSYLTAASKSGSTIRIDQVNHGAQYAIYFNCHTTLIDTFRHMYPDEFVYEGNRSIVFDTANEVPVEALKHCIELALTYHLNKKQRKHRSA